VTEVHLLVPAGYTDPNRPSGGNAYDGHVAAGLAELGWTVVVHEVPDTWPAPDVAVDRAIAAQLARIPAGRVVVVDGLLATAAASALVAQAARLCLVALVHMPGPPGAPPGAVLRAAHLIIVTSQWTGRSLVEQHGLSTETIVVAPPGVQLAEPSRGTATGGSLLCVAAVMETKGHDVLFAALSRLVDRRWDCTCVGALDLDPPFVDRLRHALTDRGIADRVRLTGPLVGAELELAYGAADVLVLASRQEGYGMVVTEALARGLPVISTSVGGVPEALGQVPDGRIPGILVPSADAPALGGAIASWLDDPGLRDDLRSLAHSRRAMLAGWDQPVTRISAALGRLAAA
jgi:glycosyltransferase involved in cell wall biosynthesis